MTVGGGGAFCRRLRSNESDEFLAYYPELEDEFRQVRLQVDHLLRLLEAGLDFRLSRVPAPQLLRLVRKLQSQRPAVSPAEARKLCERGLSGAHSANIEVVRTMKIAELEQLLEEASAVPPDVISTPQPEVERKVAGSAKGHPRRQRRGAKVAQEKQEKKDG